MSRNAFVVSFVLAATFVSCGEDAPDAPSESGPPASNGSNATAPVVINGREMSAEQREAFAQIYRVQPAPGEYWYDAFSGLWGNAGGPSAGFLLAGHDFGPLAPDVSKGDSNVHLNGRHLPRGEVLMFSTIVGAVAPGRYWLDGQGNYGYEGYPQAVGNLYMALAQNPYASGGAAGGGDNFWSTRFSAGNSNADNSQGYVSVPGVGPVSYGM